MLRAAECATLKRMRDLIKSVHKENVIKIKTLKRKTQNGNKSKEVKLNLTIINYCMCEKIQAREMLMRLKNLNNCLHTYSYARRKLHTYAPKYLTQYVTKCEMEYE